MPPGEPKQETMACRVPTSNTTTQQGSRYLYVGLSDSEIHDEMQNIFYNYGNAKSTRRTHPPARRKHPESTKICIGIEQNTMPGLPLTPLECIYYNHVGYTTSNA